MVSTELDERDFWLEEGYQPIPYALRDVRGKTVSLGGRAQAAAEFLATRIWGAEQGSGSESLTGRTQIEAAEAN
eukprot:15471308-Alexandrium_andersonii.AAC.1